MKKDEGEGSLLEEDSNGSKGLVISILRTLLGGLVILMCFDYLGLSDVDRGDIGHFRWVVLFWAIKFWETYGDYVWSWRQFKFVPPEKISRLKKRSTSIVE